MERQFKLIIGFNVVSSIFFLLFNTMLWGDYASVLMTPFEVTLIQPWFEPPIVLPNLLFWLFWLSTVVNLYFIIKVQRKKI